MRTRTTLTLLFCLLSVALIAQDPVPDKGSGILYFSGKPASTPIESISSEYAYDMNTGKVYTWSRDSSDWYPYPDITHSFAAPSGDPGTDSKLHIDRTNGNLYQWDGDSWEQIIGGGASTAALADTSAAIRADALELPDTASTVSTKYYADLFNDDLAGRGTTTKQSFLDSLAGFQSFADITSIQTAETKVNYIIENRSNSARYKVSNDSIPGLSVDNVSQIRLSNGRVAQLIGAVKLSYFLNQGLSNVEAVRSAISYAENRTNQGGGISRYVYFDVDTITLNDTILLPERVVLEGMGSGGTKSSAYSPGFTRGTVVWADLNDNTKSLFVSDENPTGGGYAEGWGLKNMTIHAKSPALCAIKALKPGYVEIDRVFTFGDTLISGSNDFFVYDMVLDGSIHTNITNSRFNGGDSCNVYMPRSYWISTTTNFVNCQFKGNSRGIIIDTTSINYLMLDNCTFEGKTNECMIVNAGNRVEMKDLYTESVATSNSVAFRIGGGTSTAANYFNVDGFKYYGNSNDTVFYITDDTPQFSLEDADISNVDYTFLNTASMRSVYFVNVREVGSSSMNYIYDLDGISDVDKMTMIHCTKRETGVESEPKSILPNADLYDGYFRDRIDIDQNAKMYFSDIASFTDATTKNMSIYHTLSANLEGFERSIRNETVLNSSTNVSTAWTNFYNAITYLSPYTHDNITANYSLIRTNGSNSVIAEARGFSSLAQLTGVNNGSIATLKNYTALTPTRDGSGTGTITDAIGYHVANQGASFVTDAYGIYIEDQSDATNNYALRTGEGLHLFSDFGDNAGNTLSSLSKSAGTHPYPVFASDGTLANESSIPASDISELPDSLNTLHWTHNNTLSNGDTLTLSSHQMVIYLGPGDSIYIDESNLTRDAVIRIIQSSGISTIFKADGLSNRFYELGTDRSYSKTIGTGSVKTMSYNQATNHWYTDTYYQADVPIEDATTTTDTVVVYRGMEIDMDGSGGSYTVQLDVSELNEGEAFNIKADNVGASTVTIDVLNEGSVIQYEGDSIAATHDFTGAYEYVSCSWRSGVLYITK